MRRVKKALVVKEVPTFSLRLEIADLVGNVRDDRLDLVMALLGSRDEPTASGSAESLGDLLTLGHRVGLRPPLLGDGADLPRPFAALLVGDVALLGVLALLLVLGPALGDVVHHDVGVVPSPALADVLRLAYLGSGQVTVLSECI